MTFESVLSFLLLGCDSLGTGLAASLTHSVLPKSSALSEKLRISVDSWRLHESLGGSLQNRPMGDGLKPANGVARNIVPFIPFSPAQASPFWCASYVARISGCDRDGADGRAWR